MWQLCRKMSLNDERMLAHLRWRFNVPLWVFCKRRWVYWLMSLFLGLPEWLWRLFQFNLCLFNPWWKSRLCDLFEFGRDTLSWMYCQMFVGWYRMFIELCSWLWHYDWTVPVSGMMFNKTIRDHNNVNVSLVVRMAAHVMRRSVAYSNEVHN